jgi:Hypothetical protein (DUF2513)
MKRDMDFVRDLLSKIEEADGRRDMVELMPPDASDDDWKKYPYHLTLLNQAGLVAGINARDISGENWLQVNLTWAGHEFLDTMRDPDVWQRTKDGAKKVGNFSMPFLMELGKAYAKHVAKEKLGLEL